MGPKTKGTAPKRSKMEPHSFASRLENMILTGAFKPRERLIEAALSEKLGVSRYTVRDTFKTLEAKGLVSVTPFKGVVVRELSKEEVEEIFVIRASLETLAARLCLGNVTPEDVRILRKKVEEIENARRQDDFVALVSADTSFHDQVFQLSRNKSLHRMINDLRARCQVIRYSAWSSPDILRQIMEEHHLMVDAIETGDVTKICELSEKHISHAKEAYLLRIKTETALLP